jgi:hypothetical protein
MNTLQDRKEEIFNAINQNQELYRPSRNKIKMIVGRVLDYGGSWPELFDNIDNTQALFPREKFICKEILNQFYNPVQAKKEFDPLAAIFNFFKKL